MARVTAATSESGDTGYVTENPSDSGFVFQICQICALMWICRTITAEVHISTTHHDRFTVLFP